MHPDSYWMIYQTDATVRHQHRHAAHVRRGVASPRLHQSIARWSGQSLLRLGHWLLQDDESTTQQALSMQR